MTDKRYIEAQELLEDSWQLGAMVADSLLERHPTRVSMEERTWSRWIRSTIWSRMYAVMIAC